ncbi:MAG: hypothetical protein ACFE0O_07830 [Opitutales bacterium]
MAALSDLPQLQTVPEARIAVLGGTHLNDAIFDFGGLTGWFGIDTPAGPSPRFYYGETGGVGYYYTHFHGEGKWVETWLALETLGVTDALGGATAGGVNPAMKLYDFVVPDDFIDLNIDRPPGIPMEYLPNPHTAYPRFVPAMDEPLRQILIEETRRAIRPNRDFDDINIHVRGVSCQTRGGRFETEAEIAMLRQQGADLVTMNVGTEIAYARQLGIHFAVLHIISNPAEGIAPWTWKDMHSTYPRLNPVAVEITLAAIRRIAALPADTPRSGDAQREHPPLSYKTPLPDKFK